jgi:predicted nucleic acid-binding protein
VRVVADTNVIVYHLLKTEPFVEETRAFWRKASRALAPASWEAEVANVLWQASRHRVVPVAGALRLLRLSGQLAIHSVPVRSLWEGALALASGSGVSVYDTLFVELARRRSLPLATFDQQVLDRFADVATRPGQL